MIRTAAAGPSRTNRNAFTEEQRSFEEQHGFEENFYLLAEAVILQAKADYLRWHDSRPQMFDTLKKQILHPCFFLYLPLGVTGEQVVAAFEGAYQKSLEGGKKNYIMPKGIIPGKKRRKK